jgi:hypothetical protein
MEAELRPEASRPVGGAYQEEERPAANVSLLRSHGALYRPAAQPHESWRMGVLPFNAAKPAAEPS